MIEVILATGLREDLKRSHCIYSFHVLQSLSIQAALLPSLQAQYRMEQVSSLGFTGAKAKFSVHLPTHHLSFSTRLQDLVWRGGEREFIIWIFYRKP